MKRYFLPITLLSIVALLSVFSTISKDAASVRPIPDNALVVTTTSPILPVDKTLNQALLEPMGAVQTVKLKNGRSLSLSLPKSLTLSVVAEDYHHLRFMALSPDKRLFVGEMRETGDSSQGRVLIFEGFDPAKKVFKEVHSYLTGLRNPHSVAFYTDTKGQSWIYIALTDKLVRYPYHSGDVKPKDPEQVISAFADYGRPWSQGGWHLTRTVVTNNNKIYVSVGSSCNSCEEKSSEPERASILEMNPDGSEKRVFANGLRNAVGLVFKNDNLYATGNNPDHLGDDRPEDLFLSIHEGKEYGWPYCYELRGELLPDSSQPWKRVVDCASFPLALAGLEPHSAPLGIEAVDDLFLVALHGSGQKELGIGYKVVAISPNRTVQDVITGFLEKGEVHGRPVGILRRDAHSFFVTDDYNGAIYLVEQK